MSSRKKIRGWKRRLKAIESWEKVNTILPIAWLRQHGRYHVRCYVSPWYDLDKRSPPMWFFRKVLQAFIRLHTSWKASLDAEGAPYHLQFWVYEPERYRTDLVVHLGESPIPVPFTLLPRNAAKLPTDFYQLPELSAFAWTVHESGDYMEAEDMEYFGYTLEGLEREEWQFYEEQNQYFLPRGWMQIGTLI